jgi:hypothetical protein
MSPKVSRPADEPDDEPDELAIPPGHVPITPRVKRELKRPEPISVWWKLGGLVVVLAAIVVTIVLVSQPPDPRSSARGMAELAAESFSRADLDAFVSYLCYADELDLSEVRVQVAMIARHAGRMTVLDVSDDYDGVASATLTSSRRPDIDTVLLMHNEEGPWCLVEMSTCPLADDSAANWPIPITDFSGCRNRPGRGR